MWAFHYNPGTQTPGFILKRRRCKPMIPIIGQSTPIAKLCRIPLGERGRQAGSPTPTTPTTPTPSDCLLGHDRPSQAKQVRDAVGRREGHDSGRLLSTATNTQNTLAERLLISILNNEHFTDVVGNRGDTPRNMNQFSF